MKTKLIKLADIKPSKGNPRTIDKEEFEKLKRSIEEFGNVEPLILRAKDLLIIGGHQRYKALMELKHKQTDCVLLENISNEQAKALNIALNKISGDWDEDKLKTIFQELLAKNYDLVYTGYDKADVENLLTQFDNMQKTIIEKESTGYDYEAFHTVKLLQLFYDYEKMEELVKLLEVLAKAYKQDNNSDIVFEALKNEANRLKK